MGATNVPWQLDPAILRPGRFDEKVYIPLPDLAARRHMLDMYLSKRPVADDMSRLALRCGDDLPVHHQHPVVAPDILLLDDHPGAP